MAHKLTVEFCTSCGTLDKAVKIIHLINTRYSQGTIESYTFIPGKYGAFEVTLDDRLIFSKLSTNRFPTDRELLEKFRAILGPMY
jgi:selT/selW/selH-like putative selenoprotein